MSVTSVAKGSASELQGRWVMGSLGNLKLQDKYGAIIRSSQSCIRDLMKRRLWWTRVEFWGSSIYRNEPYGLK